MATNKASARGGDSTNSAQSPVNAAPRSAEQETATEARHSGSGGDTYVVRNGDSLESIAADNDMTASDLKGLNPSIDNSNFVYEGQELRLK